MTEHNNPPAFPCAVTTSNPSQPGVTLLDHFAGLAMQGLVSGRSYGHVKGHTEATAKTAYEMADAMLKERQKWIK